MKVNLQLLILFLSSVYGEKFFLNLSKTEKKSTGISCANVPAFGSAPRGNEFSLQDLNFDTLGVKAVNYKAYADNQRIVRFSDGPTIKSLLFQTYAHLHPLDIHYKEESFSTDSLSLICTDYGCIKYDPQYPFISRKQGFLCPDKRLLQLPSIEGPIPLCLSQKKDDPIIWNLPNDTFSSPHIRFLSSAPLNTVLFKFQPEFDESSILYTKTSPLLYSQAEEILIGDIPLFISDINLPSLLNPSLQIGTSFITPSSTDVENIHSSYATGGSIYDLVYSDDTNSTVKIIDRREDDKRNEVLLLDLGVVSHLSQQFIEEAIDRGIMFHRKHSDTSHSMVSHLKDFFVSGMTVMMSESIFPDFIPISNPLRTTKSPKELKKQVFREQPHKNPSHSGLVSPSSGSKKNSFVRDIPNPVSSNARENRGMNLETSYVHGMASVPMTSIPKGFSVRSSRKSSRNSSLNNSQVLPEKHSNDLFKNQQTLVDQLNMINGNRKEGQKKEGNARPLRKYLEDKDRINAPQRVDLKTAGRDDHSDEENASREVGKEEEWTNWKNSNSRASRYAKKVEEMEKKVAANKEAAELLKKEAECKERETRLMQQDLAQLKEEAQRIAEEERRNKLKNEENSSGILAYLQRLFSSRPEVKKMTREEYEEIKKRLESNEIQLSGLQLNILDLFNTNSNEEREAWWEQFVTEFEIIGPEEEIEQSQVAPLEGKGQLQDDIERNEERVSDTFFGRIFRFFRKKKNV